MKRVSGMLLFPGPPRVRAACRVRGGNGTDDAVWLNSASRAMLKTTKQGPYGYVPDSEKIGRIVRRLSWPRPGARRSVRGGLSGGEIWKSSDFG